MKSLSSRLRHQIKFMKKIYNQEDYIQSSSFEEQFSTFAEIMPLNASSYNIVDSFNFGLISTEKLFKFTVRFRDDINEKLYIRFNDRIFEIKKLINILENNLIIEILCLEIEL